jgi:hypothetical protein
VLAIRPRYRLYALTNATSSAGLRKKSLASACITLFCSPKDWNPVPALSEGIPLDLETVRLHLRPRQSQIARHADQISSENVTSILIC